MDEMFIEVDAARIVSGGGAGETRVDGYRGLGNGARRLRPETRNCADFDEVLLKSKLCSMQVYVA